MHTRILGPLLISALLVFGSAWLATPAMARRGQIDDMNLATLAENIRRHLGVPETGLVTEVHTSLQHLAH